jgi:hypothetical protein
MSVKLGRPTKILTEQQVRQAMKHTKSNMSAARYLNMTLPTYRLYAQLYIDAESGKTLYDLHMNKFGKGIPKFQNRLTKEPTLEKLLVAGMSVLSYSIDKLKSRLIYEGLLAPQCSKCGFTETRVLDYKAPIVLSFKDGCKSNWMLDNLEFLCYNCYFLYVGDLFTKKQTQFIEDSSTPVVKTSQTDWEIDDYFTKHFEAIGLVERQQEPGTEFIDRI